MTGEKFTLMQYSVHAILGLNHYNADQVAYRESEDADFYYKTGFTDGVQLMFMLQKQDTNLQ